MKKFVELDDRAKENGYKNLEDFFDQNVSLNFKEMSKILNVSTYTIAGAYESYGLDLFIAPADDIGTEKKT